MIEANVLHPSELAAEDVAAWRDWQARTPAFGNPLLGPDFACAVGGVRDDARVALFRLAGKLVGRLLAKVEDNVDDIVRVEEYAMDDAETAVVCFGGTTRAVMSALLEARAAGKKVGMFRPITVWPFPEKQLKARLPQLKNILMVEHNHGQMLLEVQRVVNDGTPVSFLGKIDGTVITPAEILAKLQEMEV